MIFVTVGNATQGFRRLLEAVEAFLAEGTVGPEPVLIQAGSSTDFKSRYGEVMPFLPMDEFGRRVEEANLIISHGGCGTLLQAVRLGKVPVVMPRRKKYGEHINDHQVQLVKALAAEGFIIPAFEPKDLPGAIAKAMEENRRREALGVRSDEIQSRMREMVAQAIEELIGQ